MISQKTLNLKLPLPHPENELKADVIHIRESFSILDASLQMLQDLVVSDDVNLDTVQEIVTILKKAQGDIGSLTEVLAIKANKYDVESHFEDLRGVVGKKVDMGDFASENEKVWKEIKKNAEIGVANSSCARNMIFNM